MGAAELDSYSMPSRLSCFKCFTLPRKHKLYEGSHIKHLVSLLIKKCAVERSRNYQLKIPGSHLIRLILAYASFKGEQVLFVDSVGFGQNLSPAVFACGLDP